MSDTCIPHHDRTTTLLTGFICIGMVISYLPQHLKIITAKSSEGFSPWFLLLGSTSSAAGMLNIIVMQWGIIKCCPSVGAGNCIESTAGIFQLFLQWFLFSFILVLYIIYYPPHLKYVSVSLDDSISNGVAPRLVKTSVKSDNWRLSIVLSWVVAIHLSLTIFITFLLLLTSPSYPSPAPSHRDTQIQIWATFLGVMSALLAALQYAPQLVHTYKSKLVGALSIKMMCIQSPGALLMVLSIALRPGTNWTTWLPYAVAGALQATLLTMCIFWHARQTKLGIDDFGRPLSSSLDDIDSDALDQGSSSVSVTAGPEEGVPVREAVGDAVHSDVREDGGESAPLLGGQGTKGKESSGKKWLRKLGLRR